MILLHIPRMLSEHRGRVNFSLYIVCLYRPFIRNGLGFSILLCKTNRLLIIYTDVYIHTYMKNVITCEFTFSSF